MTKSKLNITRLILAVVLVVALSSAVCLVAFAEDAEAVAQTRIYNESFDRLLDDGSGEGVTPAYRSVNWEAGQCDDSEDPILKLASGKISAGFETLNIELRSKTVTLADLTLALRISDNEPLKVYTLNDDAIIGGIASSFEITDQWQTLSIDFASTETGIDTTTPDAMVGFHLYAADKTKAGDLDVRKVSVSTGANETIVWNFADIDETWWGGSESGTFVDHAASYAITESKQFVSDNDKANNLDSAYKAIVLSIAGSGTVTVAPITADGVGTAKAWTALTDLEGTAVAALTDEPVNAVISLESLGATAIKGVEVAVTGGSVNIAQVFFTNMESRTAATYFPALDVDSIVYMSQFDFEYTTVGSDYDKAVEACAPFNLNYVMSYTNPSSITGGHLVFDANGQAFTQMKINSKVGSDGRRYLVIKYKLQNGATLNDFRINPIDGTLGDVLGGSQPVYANQMVAGFGLASLSEANPYQANGGYNYLVVDCKETFNSTNLAGFDMYFSGEGQLFIDEIYYADACVPELDIDNKLVFDDYAKLPAADNYWWTDFSDPSKLSVEDGALKIEVPASTGICIGGAKAGNNKDGNHRYMVLRMKGENLDMDTFRIAWLDGTTSFANAGGFVTLDGSEYVLGDEYADFIIDLDASGIDRAIEGYRLWIGGWNAEAGVLYIDEVYFADSLVAGEKTYSVTSAAQEVGTGYHYLTGGDFANTIIAPTVEISLTAPSNFVYEGFRFEFQLAGGGKVEYGVAHGLEFAAPVDPEEGEDAKDLTQTFVLDLVSIGITKYGDITGIHAHMDDVAVAGAVKMDVKYFDYVKSVTEVVLPTNDDTKPVITQNIVTTGKVGTEITLSATATDNYSESVTISYAVTLGTTAVTVTNGKFTPTEAGTYAVTITATDEAGNVATETVSIVVAANQTTDPGTTPEQPSDSGLSTGAIVGIVLGCAAVVAAAAVAVFFVLKKKKASK